MDTVFDGSSAADDTLRLSIMRNPLLSIDTRVANVAATEQENLPENISRSGEGRKRPEFEHRRGS